MTLTTGVLVGIGTILVLYGVIKKPPREPLTRTELNALYDARAKYLPQLKQLFEDYINRVEYLAKYDGTIYDPKSYKKFTTSRFNLKFSLIFIDNPIFKQIQDEDKELFKLTQQIDTYNSNVKDKIVRNFATNLSRACHVAYSFVIFAQLCRMEYDKEPLLIRFYFFIGRKMQDRWRKQHNKVNARIQELLDGAEDEM